MLTTSFNVPMTPRRLLAAVGVSLFGILMLYSYMASSKTGLWFTLDSGVFWFFNTRLVTEPLLRMVTAISNVRAFDVVSFVCMGLLYYWYYRHESLDNRRLMICLGLVMLITAVCIKQGSNIVSLVHPSPTLYFDDANRLSLLTSLPAKDASRNSFPSDHGMMLMIFAAFIGRYFGLRAFLGAAILVIIFSMPRIMSGGHWFGDVYAGSLGVACLFLPWILLTPVSSMVARFINRLMPPLVWRILRLN